MQPLVSVIIPTYNRADMVTSAISSVLSQDYKDVEIIIIDDGSTDKTNAVLSELYNMFSNIVIKTLPAHQGQCSARNAGLDLARGKYIQLLDSDDALLPGIISKHVNFLEAHPQFDLVYGDMLLSNTFIMSNPQVKEGAQFRPDIRKGTEINFDMKKTLIKNLKKPLDTKQSILYLFVPGQDYLHISTGTGLFRNNKVRYDTHIQEKWNCCADVDFWGQLIMAGFRFAYTPGLALELRIHSKNLTNQAGIETRTRYAAGKYIYDKLKCQAKKSS